MYLLIFNLLIKTYKIYAGKEIRSLFY